nr:ubiquitin-conjugating enzyme E2 G1 isoform X1 [Dasypus novemcinctus]
MRLRGSALSAVRQWRGKAPVGPTGGLKEGSGRAKSQCAPRRPRYPPLPGVRRCEKSWTERTRTSSEEPLSPPSPAFLDLGAPVLGSRVPQLPQLQPPPEPASSSSEVPAPARALGGEDDGAAVGTAPAKTAGRCFQSHFSLLTFLVRRSLNWRLSGVLPRRLASLLRCSPL